MAAERTVTVRLRLAHEAYKRALAEASADTTRFAAHTKAALSSTGDMRQLGEQMTRSVTVPLAGLGAGALLVARNFESAFSRMVGLAGVPAGEVDRLRDAVLELAGETGRGPQELADGLYYAASAGYEAAAALEIVQQSARGAAGGLGSTAQVVQAVTAVIGAYGEANVTAADALDTLAKMAAMSSFDPADITGQLGRILPIAKALGVGFDDVAAATAFMSQANKDASSVATNLTGVLQKLLVPSEQGREALAGVGLSAEQLKSAIASGGLPAALDLLRDKFAGNDQMLFKLFDDIQGFQGAQALLGASTEELGVYFEGLERRQGALSAAFSAWYGTDAARMERSLATMTASLIRFGEAMAPIAAQAAEVAAKLAEAFGRLPDELQAVVVGLVAVGIAAGPAMKTLSLGADGAKLGLKLVTRATQELQLQLALARMEGLSTGQALRSMAGGAVFSGATAGIVAVTGAAVIATAAFQHYAREKAEMTKLTNDFTDALQRERDGLQGEVGVVAGKKLLEGDLGTKLREAGVNITLFTDGIRSGSEEVRRLSDLAERYGTHSGGLFEKRLREAAAAGSPFAVELARIYDSGRLSNGEMKTLMMRTADASQAFQAGQRDLANLDYAQKAAGQSGATVASSMQNIASSIGLVSSVAGASTAELLQLQQVLELLGGSTFDVFDANNAYADALAAVDTAARATGGSSRDMAAEHRAVERAAKDVAAAQQELAEAEDALRIARQGPTERDKKDASLDVRDAQLGLAQAQQAVADAQKRLRDERAKGKEGNAKAATLDLQQAQLALERAQLRVKDAQAAQNEVLTSGEETSKKVRDALDAVTAAQDRVADAQQRQIDAEEQLRREAATGGPIADRARNIAGAYKTLRERGEDVIANLINQKRPAEEINSTIAAQRDRVDELARKYGDLNGELETYKKFLDGIELVTVGVNPLTGEAIRVPRTQAPNLPGRATGGPVTAGRAYMVGEYAPEVFIPGTSGTVARLVSGSAYSAGPTTVIVRPAEVVVNIDRETVGRAVVVWSHELPGGADIAVRSR